MYQAKPTWLKWVHFALTTARPPEDICSPARRTFLATFSKSALGLAFFPATKLFAKKKQPTIAIIGGGLAGLTVAYRLQQAGVHSTVYEASERVGGRVFTTHDFTADGSPLEIGGETIAGRHADILGLAKELGLVCQPVATRCPESLTAYFQGQRFSWGDLKAALGPFQQKILADAASLPTIPSWHSAADFRHFDEISAQQYLENIGLTGWPCQFICQALTQEHGLEADQLSAVHLLAGVRENLLCSGPANLESFQLQDGNDSLPKALADRLAGKVKTGHRLVRTKQVFSGYELAFEHGKQLQKVLEMDYVVMAIPFSVLRKIDQQVFFLKRKKLAINELNYGNGGRMFLEFQRRPWAQGQSLYSDRPFGQGWDPGRSQAHPAAIFTLQPGGHQARKFASQNPEDIARQCLSTLEMVHPGAKKLFTGKALKFSWEEAPFAQGSRSCYGVGQFSQFAGAEIEPEENMFFAGEHCSLDCKGTMNGAVQTANWTADAMLARLRGTMPLISPSFYLSSEALPIVGQQRK